LLDMPDKPKKPKNAYWLWVEDHKEEILKAAGTFSLMQCGDEAGRQWKALGASGQEPYKKKHEKLKASYDKELEAFFAKGGASAKPTKKRKGKEAKDDEEPAKKKQKAGVIEDEAESAASDSQDQISKRLAKLRRPGMICKLQYLLMIEANGGGGFKKVLSKYDKNGDGVLQLEEFTDLIRNALKISDKVISDRHIKDLVAALDDDGSGTLDVDEIQDFIDRGEETFFTGPLEEHLDVTKLDE